MQKYIFTNVILSVNDKINWKSNVKCLLMGVDNFIIIKIIL